MGLRLDELGVGIAHFFHERRNEFVEEQLVVAKLFAMANRATNDSAQYV